MRSFFNQGVISISFFQLVSQTFKEAQKNEEFTHGEVIGVF
jgi:hypothetical protein